MSGRLELSCYAAPAPLLVPNLIQSFVKEYPNIEFGLHEGNMEQVASWLKDGTADIGLTYDIYPDSDIDHELITQLAPFVVVSEKNPLAKKGEPQAFIYNKKELDQVVKQKADQATGATNPMAGKVV